jgi:plastocyanin
MMSKHRNPPIRSAAPIRARTFLAFLALSTFACGGGGDKGPTTPNNNTGNQVVSSVSVSGNVTSVNVGESVTMTASARNSAGTAVTSTFTWASSNTSIATVGASSGTVTGVAVGNAGITATASGTSITGTRFIGVTTPGQLPPPLANATIDMPGTTFDPNNIRLLVGGTITFVFTAVAHDVNFSGGQGAPAMIPVTQNQSVQRSFPTAGTFSIVCTLHAGMTGVITVSN